MSIKKASLLLIAFFIILSGCSGNSSEERIHDHLEETVALEADFKAQQSEITKLERQEQELYDQIIDLGSDELDEITNLSIEALDIIEQREEKLNIEHDSITEAKEEFQSVESLINDLKDNSVKSIGKEMYETMLNRYAAYDELYEAYKQSLDLEEELYIMLQREDLERDTLDEQIKKINSSYEKIIAANDEFNEYTKQYNDQKRDFYEAMDLNVIFSDES